MKKILTILFMLVCGMGFSQTTYYVSNSGNDSNDGITTETAWQTLDKVSTNYSFAPGDQILFEKGGVWRESLVITKSGASGNPITYGAYGSGNNPVIDGADVPVGFVNEGGNVWSITDVLPVHLIYLNDTVGHIQDTITDLAVEGDFWWNDSDSTFYVYTTKGDPSGDLDLGQRQYLVYLAGLGRKNISIRNLTIQHNNHPSNYYQGAIHVLEGSDSLTITGCTIQKNNHYGIMTTNCSHVTIDSCDLSRNGEMDNIGGNRIYADTEGTGNIVFTNNTCSYNGSESFLIQGVNKSTHITNVDIHGNTFNFNDASGIYAIHLDSAVIYNNTFDNNGNGTDPDEDYSIGILSCDNLDVYNNTITNQIFNDAIQVYSDATALWGSSHNVRIFRNYINGVTYGDGINYAFYDSLTGENLEIFSNVIINADHYGIRSGWNGVGEIHPVNIYNNTIYNCDEGGISQRYDGQHIVRNNLIVMSDTLCLNASLSTDMLFSNNLYYRLDGGDVVTFNGLSYTMLTVNNIEPTAQTGDPLFTDAVNGDFSLQAGGPAINNGVDVGLTVDILGNPISGVADIGAYEYVSLYVPVLVDLTYTQIERNYVVKHMSNKDVAFSSTTDKYFVGHNTISQGDSLFYFGANGDFPLDSLNIKTLPYNSAMLIERESVIDTLTINQDSLWIGSWKEGHMPIIGVVSWDTITYPKATVKINALNVGKYNYE